MASLIFCDLNGFLVVEKLLSLLKNDAFHAQLNLLLDMRVIVFIVVALLPVQECACTTGTESRTSANRIYSTGAYSVRSTLEPTCTASPSLPHPTPPLPHPPGA